MASMRPDLDRKLRHRQPREVGRRPRLLETHGCQGIGHAGYVRAGWDVTGVDINANHARYYPGKLVIADAATYIREHGHEYDAIHASPPCQWYTRGNAKGRATGNSKWHRSIPEIRDALLSTGRPYVIENVRDAGWDMRDPVLLCGCMFDLSVRDFTCTAIGHDERIKHMELGACSRSEGVVVHLERGRLFETNWGLTAPRRCEGEGRSRNDHPSHDWVAGSYSGARRDKYEARYIRKGGYVPPDKATVMALLGITAADREGAAKTEPTWNGLFECLPPAFTAHVGTQLLEHIRTEVAA